MASALRLTGAEVAPLNGAGEYLRSAGEIPYGARDPIGYPETGEAWIDGGAMLQRMNLALALGAGETRGVTIDAEALVASDAPGGGEPDGGEPSEGEVARLAARLLPGAGTSRVTRLVAADLAAGLPAGVTTAERALGLILGAPEFQRR